MDHPEHTPSPLKALSFSVAKRLAADDKTGGHIVICPAFPLFWPIWAPHFIYVFCSPFTWAYSEGKIKEIMGITFS
jgi:hypothetical protein